MKPTRLLVALLLAAGVMLGVSACDDGPPCLSGHYDLIPIFNGKTTTLVPMWTCDVWGKEPAKK